MNPKTEAALHSAWVTFVSVGGGMIVSAVSNGATTPEAVLAYLKANWIVWLTSNVIAPAIRAGMTKSGGSTPPPLPPLKAA